MINSMTGFGRSERSDDQFKITAEIKSVNHKYLDLGIKMPRRFNQFEHDIRSLLKNYATRGKIDLYISYEDLRESRKSLKYNPVLAREYYRYYQMIRESLGTADDIRTSLIARSPEVLELEEQDLDEELAWNHLRPVLEEAFQAFQSSRDREGMALRANIIEKLHSMHEIVDYIEGYLPQIITEYRSKLEERVKEFLENSQIEESRIAAEVTIFADKTAIDEELVRLRTHISSMLEILDAKEQGECGRRLDFIAQEMNRESNTILSKSNNINITNCGIELKTCIEKIREQVQNIE